MIPLREPARDSGPYSARLVPCGTSPTRGRRRPPGRGVASAPDARGYERHIDEERGLDRARLDRGRLRGFRVDGPVGVVPGAAAALDAVRAEVDRAAHASLGIEDLHHPDGRAVAEAADEARLTVRIPAEQHARGLAVHERDVAGLRAAPVPRLPRPARLAVAILDADLDGAGRLPRRERPVQDPGIRAGPLAPLPRAGRALRGAALRTGGTDDRVLRACPADDGAEQNPP